MVPSTLLDSGGFNLCKKRKVLVMGGVEIDVQELMKRYTTEIAGLMQRVVVAEATAEEWRRRALAVTDERPEQGE